ncbi:MAG: phospho-sugar mutase [Chlorobi bacterium]|nr:phospho-sugar mutase [Chlorobiota bacterium]
MIQIDKQKVLERAREWTKAPFDEKTREEVRKMIENDDPVLIESFYKDLEFGTGGMRGIMGTGTNRMNKYTIGKNTQGLANWLLEHITDRTPSVAVNYDVRHNSKEFARLVADVLTANGIKVYLFSEFRPTPELSFAVRHLKADAGIVLTASHNPPEYNGYKVYGSDGAQVVPPQDREIVEAINRVRFEDIRFDGREELIVPVGEELDRAFIRAAVDHATFGERDRSNIRILFTSLHGTSITIMPRAMQEAGFTDFHIVEEQAEPNGDFPTVESPNPEEPAAFTMALKKADEIGADLILATDPDADRIAVAVRDYDGRMRLLNGNQTMAVMDAFLIDRWRDAGRLQGKEFIASTIVSTDLIMEIGEANGVAVKRSLTGFKWIAKLIRDYEGKLKFIGGGEESFGYMVGDFVRDKDSITSGLLAAEIASYMKQQGRSFFDFLTDIYLQHAFSREHLVALVKKGLEGKAVIQSMMKNFRENPPQSIDGEKVVRIEDYLSSEIKDVVTGQIRPITDIPSSNVLIFYTENNTKVALRPSGTEPKIKFYISVRFPISAKEQLKGLEQQASEKISRIIKELKIDG